MAVDLDITGMGLVTPIGTSAWATFAALLEGRTTADRLAEMPEQIDATTLATALGASARARFSPVDPAVELAERAAREALFEAFPEGPPRDLRAIVASSKGAVINLLAAMDPRRTGAGRKAKQDAAVLGPHAFLCEQLRSRLKLGTTTAVVAACATAAAALHQARGELLRGECEAVLVLAVEAALHPVFVESYRRLGVLAPISPVSDHVARPLDRGRTGFTLNESAAAVVLEHPGGRTGRRVLARMTHTAMGTEPSDTVRTPERFEALAHLLADAPAGLAAIHPHAPGTAANDEAELRAIGAALGHRGAKAPAYALKGAIGHSLGASALVSLVVAALAGRSGRLPGMPWVRSPIEGGPLVRAEGCEIGQGEHLIVAAGFGGHVGVVRIRV